MKKMLIGVMVALLLVGLVSCFSVSAEEKERTVLIDKDISLTVSYYALEEDEVGEYVIRPEYYYLIDFVLVFPTSSLNRFPSDLNFRIKSGKTMSASLEFEIEEMELSKERIGIRGELRLPAKNLHNYLILCRTAVGTPLVLEVYNKSHRLESITLD